MTPAPRWPIVGAEVTDAPYPCFFRLRHVDPQPAGRANAVGSGALFDFTDGPPLATCHPAVVRELLARAPDLHLTPAAGPGVKLARWLGGSRGCPEAFALLAARDPR